jgi:tetratricopeptide (TPR) repeat protein
VEPLPNDLDLFGSDFTTELPSGEDRPPIVFDDEPLDHILYGIGTAGPTPASLYTRAREVLIDIHRACRQGEVQVAIHGAAILAAEDCLISADMCSELAGILTELVPQVPNPILKFDLRPLCPLLEKIWRIGCEGKNKPLLKKSAAPLYRWYEHHKFYDKARRVLTTLLEIHVEEGDRSVQAVARNNLAFEYLLEGRYQEGIPGFERAAAIFEEIGDAAQSANSRANCWTCRFESGESIDIDDAELELPRLSEVLSKAGFWQVRKPLILLARLAEQRGEIGEAIALVRRAITACKRSGTRYPEIDWAYLEKLKQKAVLA